MIDTRKIAALYFIGIGGIGMSALARYFLAGGLTIFGYDRSESSITRALTGEGCSITYEDAVDSLPPVFTDPAMKDKVIVIYTPAIPDGNNIITFFRRNGYKLRKRAEILGELSEEKDTLAVSGTHGKTTISTMIAHLLKQSHVGCSAFLGGISKNYDSNLLIGESRFTVMEADEYDRSFHWLHPWMAVVTSVDADHLDIYGNHQNMIDAYNHFCSKIRNGGTLVINSKIRDKIVVRENIAGFTYGLSEEAEFRSFNIRRIESGYSFHLKTPDKMIRNISLAIPGLINIENTTAASAIALLCGVTEQELRKALASFKGVERRFDIRMNYPGLVYIDDYAHHPEEIRACITNVKEYFGGRKITGIFQPHLYSRTRDHAAGFAEILDLLDEVILLPVYPAREAPIEGVSSDMILDRMKLKNKKLLNMDDIPGKLDIENIDILLTIGAGDIDRLVAPIEEMLKQMLQP